MLRSKFGTMLVYQKEGMHGVIAVGKGSEKKAMHGLLRLNPQADKNKEVPCIVGEGITFDTGGISIKPSAGMWDMKFDMHGSATVFGLFVVCTKVDTRVE